LAVVQEKFNIKDPKKLKTIIKVVNGSTGDIMRPNEELGLQNDDIKRILIFCKDVDVVPNLTSRNICKINPKGVEPIWH